MALNRHIIASDCFDNIDEISEELVGSADHFSHAVKITHRVFTTARGYAGLAPPGALKADVVCIIHGASTPFTLRKMPQSEKTARTYQLVGVCYIHGLINGEGLGVGEAQEFVLC